ncbi:hypothetical protein BSK66_31665 [Paenibacillus odorifer]|uniref:hypothetical protein n=1 Tax=Paenibacillus TaxID=44249 RepID=UPI0003E25B83|nr:MULTISPECIES: hypothetical protein [Paenibacillus]ETT46229.1 hypothetical protein C171_28277 [Paenibacillus sp. FSL H8-237]OME46651.1 hypothetical protein BSK66_31665 [Paenibacillus odorifer]
MSSKGRIEDDAAYENTLAWMVEKAELLDDPLTLAVEERNKLQRIYDFVEQRVLEYNRGQMLLTDPGRIKLYKAAGVSYQEFK